MRLFFFLNICGTILIAIHAAAQEKVPVTIAAFSTPGLAADDFYQDMGDRLENAPGHPFDVRLLIRGELGSDEAHFYALRRGRIEIAGVGVQSVSTAVPELTVLNGAYLFDSWEEIDFIYETAVIPYLETLLAKHNIKSLRHYASAWHGVYAKTPIRSPQDALEKRFRALIDPSSQLFVAALGADMFQIAATDVVTALQTGLLEAGETNTHSYIITGTYTEARYFTRTRHTPTIINVIANKQWWDALTPAQKNLVETSHPSMRESGRALRANEERFLADATAEGNVTVIEPTLEELDMWRLVGEPTSRALVDSLGGRAEELYYLVIEAKGAYRRTLDQQ